MRTFNRTTSLLLAAVLAPAAALAFTVHAQKWSATYVAAYQPVFGKQGLPFSGTLKLTVDHGIVSGTYTGTSIRPDPLYGRIIRVTGGVQHGHIMLNFGAFGGFTMHGILAQDGEISGTATVRKRLYRFLARVTSSP